LTQEIKTMGRVLSYGPILLFTNKSARRVSPGSLTFEKNNRAGRT